jgi:CRISPR-associated endoribonuclease Cas6
MRGADHMIRRFLFQVDSDKLLPPERAYAFYSCLRSLLPEGYAEAMHEQGETPISQCLYSERGQSFWQVQLLNELSNDGFSATLQELKILPVNTGDVCLKLLKDESLTADELIKKARAIEPDRFFSLRFLSPTAFKQSGRYTVLPDKELILQSLMNKWNVSFPSYPLEDEDAFRMLSAGIRVSDYNLRTTRFALKDTKIPGFIGSLRFDTHLSPSLLDICKILLVFSEYSGVGIKTALGMGGVKFISTSRIV